LWVVLVAQEPRQALLVQASQEVAAVEEADTPGQQAQVVQVEVAQERQPAQEPQAHRTLAVVAVAAL
jgi:hypothetical protein